MKFSFSRNFALRIAFVLDELFPPLIRDAHWFTAIPFRLLAGKKAELFYRFKDRAMSMSVEEFAEVYRQFDDVAIQRETDLNAACMQDILQSVRGSTVLEVGCGKGLLASRLSDKSQVTATDIALKPDLIQKYPQITFKEANIEHLPFDDQSFDTVVTTHTLEHVQNLFLAIQELRRVTRQRLIIVVPKQRPYRYTFDLHLHFFPYEHSLLTIMGTGRKNRCTTVGGDLFYVEDFE
ncbi:MAG: class I SAM-dependent methyltransferase [Anaerolineae bacterium]